MAYLVALFCRSALADRKGVTALEYGVIAGATVAVGLAAFNTIGTDLAALVTKVAAALVLNGG